MINILKKHSTNAMNMNDEYIKIAKSLFDEAMKLKEQKQIMAAINKLLEAKKYNPKDLHIWEFLALYTLAIGDAESAMTMIDEAVKIAETNNYDLGEIVIAKELYLKIIYYLNPPNLTNELIQKYYKLYSEAVHKVYQPNYNFAKLLKIFHKQKNKRLKIGFVGGDFRYHAVHFFIKDLIKFFKINKHCNIDIYVYMTCKDEDPMSYEIRKTCCVYRKVDKLNYRQLAEVIFSDGIHILIDLAGHTSYNRLPSFALKPAPIQCSWMGVPTTTGLTEIDYFLADEFSVPKNHSDEFSEKICYLPNIWESFTPSENDALSINLTALKIQQKITMPLTKNGYITFANFSNTFKLTNTTIELWAKVLNTIPNSKLLLIRDFYQEQALCNLFLSKFAKYNIQNILQRIEFIAKTETSQYYEALDQVDVILETLPVSGMTTTAEALYLGIPTLTLLGEFMGGRLSGSCINAIGDTMLNELLICENEQQFINQADYLANNSKVLNEIHQRLIQKVKNSPLCDSNLFAKNFAEAMWKIWNKFLKNNLIQ